MQLVAADAESSTEDFEPRTVRIERVQIEMDTGKSVHGALGISLPLFLLNTRNSTRPASRRILLETATKGGLRVAMTG